jgi:hypothetical protein
MSVMTAARQFDLQAMCNGLAHVGHKAKFEAAAFASPIIELLSAPTTFV